jgi:hypothetical protein
MSLFVHPLTIALYCVVLYVLAFIAGRRFARSRQQKPLGRIVLECDFPYCQCSVILSPMDTKMQPPSFETRCEKAGGIVVVTCYPEGFVLHTRPVSNAS